MELQAITASYARLAPIYDRTFGVATQSARHHAVRYINDRSGSVLEVGVGTGIALPLYAPHLEVTGIDYSAEMLSKADLKVREDGLEHVRALYRMDARALEFADASFDTVVAMHILSVVPEPERVMDEIARVVRPGGRIVITNHFARNRSPLSLLEKLAAPLADVIGWHPDFGRERIMGRDDLEVIEDHPLPPVGMITFLVLERRA